MPPPQGKSQQKGKGKGKGHGNAKRKQPKAATNRAGADDDASDASGEEVEAKSNDMLAGGGVTEEQIEAFAGIQGIDRASAHFLAWLNHHGAQYPKLEWPVWSWPGQPHDGERGVRCTEGSIPKSSCAFATMPGAEKGDAADIAPGDEMFSIPGKILFNRYCPARSLCAVRF
eukprot:3937265-Rhodomonas_salina.5